jgi:hypothetical protein
MINPLATHFNDFTRRRRYQVSNHSHEIPLSLDPYLGNGETGFIVGVCYSFNLTLEKDVHAFACFLFFCNYSGILPQRHQGTKITELFLIIDFLMPGTLKLMSQRLINKKSPLFNLYSSSLWVFVPWWLNSYVFLYHNQS